VKTFALTTLIAAGLALSSTAALAAMDEATKEAVATCQAEKTAPRKGVEACTTVLDKVKMGAKNTLAIHYYRGAFYSQLSDNDKARADYDAAIKAYETDPDKANWPVDFAGLAASSYALRAQIASKCQDAQADYQKAGVISREVSDRTSYEKRARDACK